MKKDSDRRQQNHHSENEATCAIRKNQMDRGARDFSQIQAVGICQRLLFRFANLRLRIIDTYLDCNHHVPVTGLIGRCRS